ncbi:MAG: endonuclease/exonuclease/phosphatase family protein [Sandaracinaceae bacterium]|nr:endonuclease/exonuclease/phosphatase family protein [Sandaracinaceae bacterium]
MSLNIRYDRGQDGANGWEHRARALSETIIRSGADIVGIQEGSRPQLEDIVRWAPQYSFLGVGSAQGDARGVHAAILLRNGRFRILDRGVFWISSSPAVPGSRSWGNEEPRMCSWVHVQLSDSPDDVWFFNTHLDHRAVESRREGLRLIASRLPRDAHANVIVGGDFNLTEDDPALAEFAASTGLRDAYRSVHPTRSASEGTYHGFRSNTDGRRIDFLFVSDEFHIQDTEIFRHSEGEPPPSDHFPVLSRLQLPSYR